jgi:hypothetical protein
VQNATNAVFNKMRVAIKKTRTRCIKTIVGFYNVPDTDTDRQIQTDHATRGPWTPGKYDVVCSAHNDISRTSASQSVGIIMLDVFQC